MRGAFAEGVQWAALSVARGNGKSALMAGIAAATLDGPLVAARAETLIVAASFQQGRVLFDFVLAYLHEQLKDRARWRVSDSMQVASIMDRETGVKVRVLGSDPRRAHGLAPVLVLADEPVQWPESTGTRMLAALRTAAGKQPAFRFVALGTRPASSEHWFEKMLTGGADYAQCHAASPDDPKFSTRTWRRANPSLDHMPDLRAAIAAEALHAKSDPGMIPEFDALRLNLGTSDTATANLLEASTWARIEGAAVRAGRCVWGLDLGTSAAQSAVVAYWPDSGALQCLAAFPSQPALAERGLRDGVASLYVDMAKRGELIMAGGRAVDLSELVTTAMARFGPPSAVAADRWRAAELRDTFEKVGVPPVPLSLRGQGFKDGGEDVRDFRRACLEGRVVPAVSLLLRTAMRESRVVLDPAGNSKLAKNAEGQRRVRARDDATAAAILVVAVGSRLAAQPKVRRLHYGLAG